MIKSIYKFLYKSFNLKYFLIAHKNFFNIKNFINDKVYDDEPNCEVIWAKYYLSQYSENYLILCVSVEDKTEFWVYGYDTHHKAYLYTDSNISLMDIIEYRGLISNYIEVYNKYD
jgi:hypothetical protein